MSHQEIAELIPPTTHVIGISCMFTVDWLSTCSLVNFLGKMFPSAIIVAGGEHVTALPEFCMQQCPALQVCALGEGEETILEICEAFAGTQPWSEVKGIIYRQPDGSLNKTERRERVRSLDTLPRPAWQLFPTATYFRNKLNFGVGGKRTLPILATRGCPYVCSFCSSPEMWGTRYFMRSVENVVNEIEYLVKNYGVENIDLYDLTAIINARWIIDFSKELLRRQLHITWQLPSGTRSEAITPEVLHYMKISGCTVVTYAPENGSDRILNLIHKKVNLSKMLHSIKHSNQEGIYVKINIILGFPQETHRDVWKTIVFILKASWYGAYDMGPNPFYPIPGTELFNELQKQGKVDIYNASYFDALLDADNMWKVTFYNEYVSHRMLKLYFLFYFFVFYTSNFVFRPARLFTTIWNVYVVSQKWTKCVIN